MKKTLLTLAGASVLSMSAQAEQFWADNSISLLQGSDYKMVNPFSDETQDLTTMTLEHVSGHSWGGVFMFVDRHIGETQDDGSQFKETYGEVSPKFTVVKMDGFVSAVNLAYTYEHNSTSSGFSQDNNLFGAGVDLSIPGMDFASATYFYAQNELKENDHQITLTYGASFGDVIVDGYIDYSTGTEDSDHEFHFNPQLTYNVGSLLGTKNKVKVGVEYSYWENKFGWKDRDGKFDDQNAVSLLLKAHL